MSPASVHKSMCHANIHIPRLTRLLLLFDSLLSLTLTYNHMRTTTWALQECTRACVMRTYTYQGSLGYCYYLTHCCLSHSHTTRHKLNNIQNSCYKNVLLVMWPIVSTIVNLLNLMKCNWQTAVSQMNMTLRVSQINDSYVSQPVSSTFRWKRQFQSVSTTLNVSAIYCQLLLTIN